MGQEQVVIFAGEHKFVKKGIIDLIPEKAS